MAWSSRRDGTYLVVGDVPDDVAVYINAKADTEGKSVDAVVCEMLAKAKNGTGQVSHVQPQPAPTVAHAADSERRVYGVMYDKDGRMLIESAALLKETPKTYIVTYQMRSYQYKHIPKLNYDGTVRPVAFSARQAAEQSLAWWRAALERTRSREPTTYCTAEDIQRTATLQESRVSEAEALLASVSADGEG